MKVVIYVRVSTDTQADEGYSLDAQIERCKAFCLSQGWDVGEIYVEEGESAKDMDRPQLQKLLTDAEQGLFDVVLVYKLDRLTRSVRDLYKLLDTFETHSIKFKSATEVYDTTSSMGKLFITIVAALAEWELGNLRERVRFGMEQLVREGKWHGGPVPFGYEWDGETMHIIPEEANILKELRQIYMSGEGFKGTARILNSRGQYRREYHWSAQSVWYCLDNPIYAGKLRYGEKKKNGKYATRKKEELVNVIWSDIDIPTIFTWEEYEAHNARMKRRSFSGYSKVREYWFAGALRCGRCGSRMTGRYHQTRVRQDGGRTRYLSYICISRQAGTGCDMPMIRQELVEQLLMKYIHNIKPDQEALKRAQAKQSKKNQDNKKEIDKLKSELNRIEERRKKWQYLFVENAISLEDLKKRKSEEDENEHAAQHRLRELSASDQRDDTIMNLLFDLPEIWDESNDEEKNSLITAIFKNIVLESPEEKPRGKKGKFIRASIANVEYN